MPPILDFDEHRSVLSCRGQEDRSTQGLRNCALARARRARTDIVVDLTALSYGDSSLMLDLVMLARRLQRRGNSLVLRAPCDQIRALIAEMGLLRLDGLRVERADAALA